MDSCKAALEKVALFVLEDWALMMPDPCDEPEFNAAQPFFLAEMNYRGEDELLGSISILAQRSFAEALARNLLGLDPEDEIDEAGALDALREMANVLTGHFVTEVYGVDEPFELLSPGVKRIEQSAVQPTGDAVAFTADDEPVLIWVKLPKGE